MLSSQAYRAIAFEKDIGYFKMLARFLASFAIFGLIAEIQAQAQVNDNGYYKGNGTYAQPHVMTKPDGNPYNNYSSPWGSVCRSNSGSYLNTNPVAHRTKAVYLV
jgi:hypothetical protein